MAGLRRGQSKAIGDSGDFFKLTADVFSIGGSLMRATPWMGFFAFMLAAAPAITLGHYFKEQAFAWYWGQKNRPEEPVGVAPEVSL